MSKQKVTLPQTVVVFLALAGFMYALWWTFLGPGSEPPPHRLSAPFPGEEQMVKERQGKSSPGATRQPQPLEKLQKPMPAPKSRQDGP